jgi:hypothetical protein
MRRLAMFNTGQLMLAARPPLILVTPGPSGVWQRSAQDVSVIGMRMVSAAAVPANYKGLQLDAE